MKERIPHNSKFFKERFPEVYRDFFSKCALVCSSPRSVGLVGEYVGYEAPLAMRQALPIRTYVGITPRRTHGLDVVEYRTFHPEKGMFHEHILENDLQDHIQEKLMTLLQANFPSVVLHGYDIRILSELPLERSLGGAGSLFVPLTVSMLLAHDLLKKEHIDSWKNAPLLELIANTETKFDLTFRTIWKIETALYYTASGINHFIPLVPSAVPVLFTSKKGLDSEELMQRVRSGVEVDFNQSVDQSHYWGARSNELFGKHIEWPFPFDWGVISTEQSRMVHDSMFTTADVQEELHEVAREAVKIKEQLLEKSFTGEIPDFFRLCETKHSSELWQYYIGFLSFLSFQALLMFKKIFERGSSKKYVSELFELLNKIHGTFYSFGLCTDKIIDSCI